MALKATVYKAELQIADLERNYFGNHPLTLARHPSETEGRLMLRLVLFARHAHSDLTFSKGLSTEDEPDLWLKDLSGEIETWIELGQPDIKRVRKACGRARQVFIYCHGGHSAQLWWEKQQAELARFQNLHVIYLPPAPCEALADMAQRNVILQCTLQDGQLWVNDGLSSVLIEPVVWK